MNKLFRPYVVLIIALAAACLLAADWSVPTVESSALWNALAAFLVLAFISEASYLELRVGRTATQSSIAFIPYIAAFVLFDSGWTALIVGASMGGVDLLVRRKNLIRLLFNLCQVVVSVFLASEVYRFLGGTPALSPTGFQLRPVAIAAGAATYFLVNGTAVSIWVSLLQGQRFSTVWLRIAGASLGYDLVSAPLGPLLAYLYIRYQIPGILMLVIPLYVVRGVYRMNMQLEQVNRDLLELMVKAIEARDPYTSGHSQRVSEIAEALARQVGLSAKQVDHVRTAALLHDVGKIHEEYAPLLRKEGKLDATEKALMQTHSIRSAELVGTISAFRGAITDSVRHHHENYDGTGYPTGLAARAIPVGARIIMIADTVDAMTTDRPYRKALSFERVAQELHRYSGRQFDPQLVEAFLASSSLRDLLARKNVEPESELDLIAEPRSSPQPAWLHRESARSLGMRMTIRRQ